MAAAPESATSTPSELGQLIKKLDWVYPFQPATMCSAKQSATALPRLAEHRTADETQQMFQFVPAALSPRRRRFQPSRDGLSAADVGVAYHKFFHLMDFAAAKGRETLIAEADRMEAANFLTAAERKALDVTAVLAFWQSEIGQKVLAHSRYAHREIPFTLRCTVDDLKAAGVSAGAQLAGDEFFIVRGVVDLAIILQKEIWLLDFKTDALTPEEVASARQRYTPQLRIYVQALSRIYRRPATEIYLHFLTLNRTEKLPYQT